MDPENIDYRERWREESRQMFDDSEAKKAVDNVFDFETKKALVDLYRKGFISKMYGNVEAGKESNIYLAEDPEGEINVLKIYMTRAGNFRDMHNYLRGDKRFRNVSDNRKDVVKSWAKKEFKNLKRARSEVNCPKPITVERNIIQMDFIGQEKRPYPKLHNVDIENPEIGLKQTVKGIKSLWNNQDIVHGDLSPFNILVQEDKLVWIDFSQGVHKDHPEAEKLLKRDVRRVTKFFNQQGAEEKPEKIIDEIIGSS